MAKYGEAGPEAKKRPVAYIQKKLPKSRPDGLNEFWKTSHWAAWFGIVGGIFFNLQAITMQTESAIHQIYQILHYVGGDILILLGAMANIMHKIRLRDSTPYDHEKY